MERGGHLESIWQTEVKHYGQENINSIPDSDILIVGAGITGITTALMLQKKGFKCILVEAGNMGYGSTGGSTAHINNYFETPYHKVIKTYGLDSGKLLAKAAREASDIIKDNINIYQIYCDYAIRNGYLFSLDERQDDELQNIIEGNHLVGIDAIETNTNPFGIPSVRVIEIHNQAQFHPLRYLRILLKEFVHSGGMFLENCSVTSSIDENTIIVADSSKGPINCKYLIYANNTPPGDSILNKYINPYIRFAMALKLKNGYYPEAMAYDMFEPHHSYRSHTLDENDFLIAGGEDNIADSLNNSNKSFEKLYKNLKLYFDIEEIVYKWKTKLYKSKDGLPYIGYLPGNHQNVFCAIGYGGDDIILGTVAAIVICDIITSGNSKYEQLFSPERILKH